MTTETVVTGTAPAAVVPADSIADSNGAFTGKEAETNPGSPPGVATGDKPAEPANTDGQTAGDQPAEEAAKPAGAPEKYEDFKAPEGTTLDSGVMGQFAEVARELNLPQDAAQKMIDKMAPIMAQRQAEQVEQMKTDWMDQSKADKEFGGDALNDNLVHARKALDTFATPELKSILNDTGLGNHPELVRFMVRAGKAISEDKLVTGGAPASAGKTMAERMYPNMKV